MLDEGKELLHRQRVAVADAAGLDADQNLVGAGGGNVALFGQERSSNLVNDHCAHLRHCQIPFDRDEPHTTLASGSGQFAALSFDGPNRL